MKLSAAIKYALVLLVTVALNFFVFTGHSLAMSEASHEMEGMSHVAVDAAPCATLCRIAVVSHEERIAQRDEGQEDTEKATVSFSQDQSHRLTDSKTIRQQLYAADTKPPSKIPIYILYGVFRT